MAFLLHHLLLEAAERRPEKTALVHKKEARSFAAAARSAAAFAGFLTEQGLTRNARVAVWLPKGFECVAGMLGTSLAGGIFVPINPVLKPPQVIHILRDCDVTMLVTNAQRASQLAELLAETSVRAVVLTDPEALDEGVELPGLTGFAAALEASAPIRPVPRIDTDVASILYTSGSTGRPKGVVLSHRNMVCGATSVASYLENTSDDRILAVLPFSFDAGLSQLTTAFYAGASVVMLDYLLPRDVLRTLAEQRITGITGVPPLWVQLVDLDWPKEIASSLRYLANTGGAMPRETLRRLQDALPETSIFLMYGLTEAFRSTYLPPSELPRRPGSIGKAIPNAEILVLRPDGTECGPDEPGELVHRGALVAQGYWNDPERTREKFRPLPAPEAGFMHTEIAVWSGDTVKKDSEGFLYFIGRRDEMIKSSGYRISPVEVEDALYSSDIVAEAAVIGVADAALGQRIVALLVPKPGADPSTETVLDACRRSLPPFMVPSRIEWRDSLPRNPNGKIDRKLLADQLSEAS